MIKTPATNTPATPPTGLADSASLIPFPRYQSEAHVQSRLLHDLDTMLKDTPYTVCAEVRAYPTPQAIARAKLRGHTARKKRLDLVIFSTNAIAIIEVKREPSLYSAYHKADVNRATKQTREYREYGIPVLLCWGSEEIDQTLSQVRTIIGV